MPRKASSVSEIAQIERVRALLTGIGVTPSPLVEVVTASGKSYTGQLLRDLVGNTPKVGGWSSYGVITLATERGKVQIDYLDIVTVQRSPQDEPSSYLLGAHGRQPGRRTGRTRGMRAMPAPLE
jgi:hypothetical protein